MNKITSNVLAIALSVGTPIISVLGIQPISASASLAVQRQMSVLVQATGEYTQGDYPNNKKVPYVDIVFFENDRLVYMSVDIAKPLQACIPTEGRQTVMLQQNPLGSFLTQTIVAVNGSRTCE